MPVYQSSEQLYQALQLLFNRIAEGESVGVLHSSRLAIRFTLTSPAAQVAIDGRESPVKVHYGTNRVRPDLDVALTADALHRILLRELPLRKALGSGLMKVRGPVWKTVALEKILHAGQDLYPQVAGEIGLDTR
jgi:hypothetical protein